MLFRSPPTARLEFPNASGGNNRLAFVFSALVQTDSNYLFWFKSAQTGNMPQLLYNGSTWLSFQDLWLIVDTDGQYELVLASAPSATQDEVIIGTTHAVVVNSILANLADFNKYIYSRVFNVCASDTECAQRQITKVIDRPDSSPYTASGNKAPLFAAATKQNHFATDVDNKPVNTDAWLDYWGATYQDSGGSGGIFSAQPGPCSSINTVVQVLTGGVSRIIAQFINCVVVDWAKDLNEWLYNSGGYKSGGSSPFGAVACISSVPSGFIGRAHAQDTDPCPESSTAGLGSFETELKNKTGSILKIWEISMSIIDVIVILALLAIAFANILHININVYAAKKALPGLIIGIILANSSILLIRFLADVCAALSTWAASIGGNGGITSLILIYFPAAIGKAIVFSIPTGAGLILLLLSPILMIYYLFLIVAFIFALFKRIIILYFLVMVAPLAFVAYGVPTFQQYFTKWWDAFLRYLFLFPIILFGMAMTVILAGTLGIANITYAWTVPSFVSLMMVFVAGTMVLKLPKLVTKGAIDAGAMFKKAIGAAPGIMSAGGAIHGWNANRKIAGMQREHDAIGINPAGQVRKANLARDLTATKNRRKIVQGRWGTARGYANIFGRPEETAKTWWEARTNEGKAKDMLESSKLTVGKRFNIADTVMGPDTAYKAQLARIRKDMNEQNINSPDQINKFASESPLKTKKILEEIWDYKKGLAPAKQMELMTDFGQAVTAEKFDEILTNNPALAAQLQGAGITNMASVEKGGVSVIIARQLSRSGHPGTQDLARRLLDLDRMAPYGVATPGNGSQGGGGPTPSGNAGPGGGPSSGGGGGDGNPSYVRGAMAADWAASIKEEAAKTFKDTFAQLTKQYSEASEELDIATGQDQIDQTQVSLIREKLDSLHGESLKALGETITDEAKEMLKVRGGIGSMSQDTVRRMVEDTSAAMDMGIHAGNAFQEDLRQNLQQTVAAAHNVSVEAESIDREVAKQYDAGDYNDVISQRGEAQIDALVNKFGTQIDRLVKASGREPSQALNRQLIQTLANSINAPGGKSLLGGLKSSFSTFGSTIVKQLGLNQIGTNNSIATRIARAEKMATSTGSVQNVTNVKVENTNPTVVSPPNRSPSPSVAPAPEQNQHGPTAPVTPLNDASPPEQGPSPTK